MSYFTLDEIAWNEINEYMQNHPYKDAVNFYKEVKEYEDNTEARTKKWEITKAGVKTFIDLASDEKLIKMYVTYVTNYARVENEENTENPPDEENTENPPDENEDSSPDENKDSSPSPTISPID